MKIPRSVKKWATRRTGPDGTDSYFRTKKEAIVKAQALLALGLKRVVHVARISEKWYDPAGPTRSAYKDVETWGIVTTKGSSMGVIRRIK